MDKNDRDTSRKEKSRPFVEAWEDIENTLQQTKPEYKYWSDAVNSSRRRGPFLEEK